MPLSPTLQFLAAVSLLVIAAQAGGASIGDKDQVTTGQIPPPAVFRIPDAATLLAPAKPAVDSLPDSIKKPVKPSKPDAEEKKPVQSTVPDYSDTKPPESVSATPAKPKQPGKSPAEAPPEPSEPPAPAAPEPAPTPVVRPTPATSPQPRGDIATRPSPARPPATSASLLDDDLPSFERISPSADTPTEDTPAAWEDGQVVFATATLDEALAIARAVSPVGFRIKSRTVLQAVGLVVTVLRTPDGMRVDDAVNVIGASFENALVDANHRYTLLGEGRVYGPGLVNWDARRSCDGVATIGIIDTGIDTRDAVLAGARIEVLDILPTGLTRSDDTHGSAVAALLVGAATGPFQGLVANARLVAVNVFEQTPSGPSTTIEWLVRAFDRLATNGAFVINASFGGPDNRILRAAIERITGRGIVVVAAGGNGGPGASPAYPAGYESVVAVTAVDAAKRPFRDATPGGHLDFAAPGVDIFVPLETGGEAYFSGTSYAAPFVAAAMAMALSQTSNDVEKAFARIRRGSEDLGDNGLDPVFGWGLPDFSDICSTRPVDVAASHDD